MTTLRVSHSNAGLIVDDGMPPSPDALSALECGASWDDVLNGVLLQLQAAGHEVQVFAGRRVLIDLARQASRPIRPRHGRPSVTLYTLIGMVTVLEDPAIGLDDMRFALQRGPSANMRRAVRHAIAAMIEGEIDGDGDLVMEILPDDAGADYEANLAAYTDEIRAVITWLRSDKESPAPQ